VFTGMRGTKMPEALVMRGFALRLRRRWADEYEFRSGESLEIVELAIEKGLYV